MQYRFKIEAGNLKREPDEHIKGHKHRIKILVDKGWPTPSDADAVAIAGCGNQQIEMYKDYFIRGSTSLGLK